MSWINVRFTLSFCPWLCLEFTGAVLRRLRCGGGGGGFPTEKAHCSLCYPSSSFRLLEKVGIKLRRSILLSVALATTRVVCGLGAHTWDRALNSSTPWPSSVQLLRRFAFGVCLIHDESDMRMNFIEIKPIYTLRMVPINR
jgi:hypothetical protein